MISEWGKGSLNYTVVMSSDERWVGLGQGDPQADWTGVEVETQRSSLTQESGSGLSMQTKQTNPTRISLRMFAENCDTDVSFLWGDWFLHMWGGLVVKTLSHGARLPGVQPQPHPYLETLRRILCPILKTRDNYSTYYNFVVTIRWVDTDKKTHCSVWNIVSAW